MNNATFGELTFNICWKTKTDITLFGNKFEVVVKAKAYFEKDGVTAKQETAYTDFTENKTARLEAVETLLNDFADNSAINRFIPRTMLFGRDGEYALLLDDKQDEDGGIAVTLAPKVEVVAQDAYL
jgi:hypothetical protein